MSTEQLIKSIFPTKDSMDLKGISLGTSKEDVGQLEGEPYDKPSSPGREVWLYSANLEENILLESSYIFGRKPTLKSSEVYLTFSLAGFSVEEVEKIRNEFIEFISVNVGQPEKNVIKAKEGHEFYFTWKIAKTKQKIDLIDYLQIGEDDDPYGDARVLKFTQS